MHIVWVTNKADFPPAARVRRFQSEGVQLTLLYNPLQEIPSDVFNAFDAAFPLIALELQLAQLKPDLVFYYPWMDTQIPADTQRPKDSIHQPSQSISVIMRSRNSGRVLEQTLKALFSQTLKHFKLLIVDSSSTDNTLAIASHYPAEILSIPAGDYYPGKVLNEAMCRLDTDLVVFLNSDAVPLTPYTLELLLEPFCNPLVQATYARQMPRPDAETWVQRDYQAAFPEGHAPGWMLFPLSLAAMRRRIWEQRPFYTAAWGSEDAEWGHWAKGAGYQIHYVPKALCMHSHNYTLRQLYGRRFIEGEAESFIYRNRYSLFKLLADWAKATIRDTLYYVRLRDFSGLPKLPLRRLIYYWGYYRGHRWGRQRQATGDDNTKRGQQEVLKDYD